MWKVVLELWNLNLPPFKTLANYGKWIQSMKSWLFVWLCTIWLLKTRDNNLEPLFDPTNVGQLRCRLTSQTNMEGNKKLDGLMTMHPIITMQTYYNLQANLIKRLQAMKNLDQFDWIKILYYQSLWMHSTFLKIVACDWSSNGYGLYWIMISMSLKFFAKFGMNACTWLWWGALSLNDAFS